MRIAMAAATAVALVVTPATPVSAAEPLSDWKIEPSDARCVAVRQYGSVDKPITLALKAPLEGDAVQVAILRSGFRKSHSQTAATLEVDGKVSETTALSYPLGGDKRRVAHLINLESEPSIALRTAKSMRITIIEGINDSFTLGPSIGIWQELQNCVTRLREIWNLGGLRDAKFATPARGNLQALFTSDDYPISMVMAEKSGSATFALLIDERGTIRDCTLVKASGIALLDSRSCGIFMQRAKLSPAIDLAGKPVKSSLIQTVNWRLQ